MSDFHADWASLYDRLGDFETSYEERLRMSHAFVLAHHATIQKNAEDVKEWEEFGRQIEKRLRYNNLGLTGGYPEMIDVLLGMAKQLRALERAMDECVRDNTRSIRQSVAMYLKKRADEILREGELHDQY